MSKNQTFHELETISNIGIRGSPGDNEKVQQPNITFSEI